MPRQPFAHPQQLGERRKQVACSEPAALAHRSNLAKLSMKDTKVRWLKFNSRRLSLLQSAPLFSRGKSGKRRQALAQPLAFFCERVFNSRRHLCERLAVYQARAFQFVQSRCECRANRAALSNQRKQRQGVLAPDDLNKPRRWAKAIVLAV